MSIRLNTGIIANEVHTSIQADVTALLNRTTLDDEGKASYRKNFAVVTEKGNRV